MRLFVPHLVCVVTVAAGDLTTRLPIHAPVAAQSPAPDSTGDEAVRAWLRDQTARLMDRLDIPGAIVTVVRHDRVIMNEGFGLADVEQKTPVDATTVFRIASVSKVFTAAAALQVTQSGRLSLTQDLRPQFPDLLTRPGLDAPLTLHQLLTHTAGFDEQLIGYINPPGVSAAPLAAYLTKSLPERTRGADDVPGYSNHGYGVAGLTVERVTGQPFDRYVRDSLFLPLGMTNTAFILEPTDGAPPRLAQEYRSDGTRRIPRSSRAYPAGNVGTTGADMAGFMQWLLVGARGADTTTPASRIARQLAGPVLTYHPALPPMGYGLSGVPIAGRTVWMKGGASPSHSAVLAVVPELDVALFVAVNRQEPLFWDQLVPDLVGRFWSDSSRLLEASPERLGASTDLDGDYRWTRAPLGSVEKLLGLAAQVRVSATETGIRVTGLELDGRWERIGPRTFRDPVGRVMAFRADETNRASHLFSIVQGQPVSFERISVPETTRFQLGTLALGSLLSIAAGIAATQWSSSDAPLVWARASVIALPVMEVATLVAGVMLARQGEVLPQGPTGAYHTALALTTATGIVAVAQMAGSVALASRSNTSRSRRALYTLGASGGGGLLWFLGTNHLIRIPF